jgi:hypothetical protein
MRPPTIPFRRLLHSPRSGNTGVLSEAMSKPAALSSISRRRGNPNWGRPMPPARALATEFEKQVRRLGLSTEEYSLLAELKSWCQDNRNRVYIPEWLLDAFGITVDPGNAA